MASSFPPSFINGIENKLGKDEAKLFFEALSQKPPVSVRLNAKKKPETIAETKIETLNRVAWAQQGYYLNERPIFTIDPLFHAGTYYVQEASSMLIDAFLDQILPLLERPIRILDLCAAPGGKSTLLADRLTPEDVLVANEVIKPRAGILVENMVKWGLPNVIVTNSDPKYFKNIENYFDIILVDAPCSGEGMFRKDANAVDEWSDENVSLCSGRQQRIVEDILPSLKQGGYLLYSTCTYSKRENEDNMVHFCENFGLDTLRLSLKSEWGISEIFHKNTYSYQCMPHKVRGEGFFISCMKKNTSGDETDDVYIKPKFELLPKNQMALLQPWVNEPDGLEFLPEKSGDIVALPKALVKDLAFISKHLFVLNKGIKIGKIMGKDFIPEHDLALSTLIAPNLPFCELTLEEAIEYLKKGEISGFGSVQALANGWTLARYKSKNIGWIKKIGDSRANNYYPKNMRILKDFQPNH